MRKSLASYLLAGAAVAAFTASACSGPEDRAPPEGKPVAAASDTIFATYQQCLAEHSDAECKDAFDKAKAEQAKTAPKFGTKSDCEAQFGAGHCETSSGGSFMPMMMGFMLGNMLANGSGGGGYYDNNRNYGPRSSPVYYGANGAIYSRGAQLGTVPGYSASSRAPMQPMTVSRGGLAGAAVAVPRTSSYSSPSGYSTATKTAPARSTGTVSRSGFGSTSSMHASGG